MSNRRENFTKAKHDHTENKESEAFPTKVSCFRKFHFKQCFFFCSYKLDNAVQFSFVNITLDWHQAVSRGGNHSIQTLPLWCFYNVTRLNVEGVLMHLKIWTRRKIEEHIAKKGEVRKQVQAQIQCKVLESTFFCWHLKNRSYSWVCILHSVSWLLLVQVYSCWVWQGSHLLER